MNLKTKVAAFARAFFQFATSKIFWKNLLQIIVISILLIVFVFQWLKCYTHHGESITVPDFRGQTLSQVKQLLRSNHLSIVVIDSSYDGEKLPLTILDQNPLPTSVTNLKVKKSRKIYVTVNSKVPPQTTLPNIWDKAFDIAMADLAEYGLKGREVERRPDKAVNTILEVRYKGKVLERPTSGGESYKIPKGSIVELVVADGGGSLVQVPRIICLPLSEAKFLVDSYNLNIGAIIPDGTVVSEETAYVWKQNPTPEPGLTVTIGSEIDLWLTQDLPVGCSNDPDLQPSVPNPDDDGSSGFGNNDF